MQALQSRCLSVNRLFHCLASTCDLSVEDSGALSAQTYVCVEHSAKVVDLRLTSKFGFRLATCGHEVGSRRHLQGLLHSWSC